MEQLREENLEVDDTFVRREQRAAYRLLRSRVEQVLSETELQEKEETG